MSLLCGKDENNNIIPVNVDNEGFMWDNLRYWRSQGKCFVATSDVNTGSTTTQGILSIVNPSGSTSKIYIYDITIKLSAAFTSSFANLRIFKLSSDPNSGTTTSGYNLKIGSNDASSVKLRTTIANGNYSGYTNGVIYNRLFRASSSSSDVEQLIVINLYNEMIELQENTGIIIECSNSSTANIRTNCNVRFMEIPSAQII